MNLTLAQLRAVAPACGPGAGAYVAPLNAAMTRFGIADPKRAAHFLAQVAHESGDLTRFRENLNYRADALVRTWPSRFAPDGRLARQYEHQPEQIANYVYANRNGNGDVASGDGWRFRGAGWVQLTFRDNHEEVAKFFGINGDIGAWLCTPDGAALSAAWFWWKHGCNMLADAGNVDAISDLINIGHRTNKIGDAIGYDKRLAKTNTAMEAFA